jgi:hypothetical protein
VREGDDCEREAESARTHAGEARAQTHIFERAASSAVSWTFASPTWPITAFVMPDMGAVERRGKKGGSAGEFGGPRARGFEAAHAAPREPTRRKREADPGTKSTSEEGGS